MSVAAFTGMPGSGKSVAVEVAKERGIPVVRMGDLVREEAERRDLELTDENLGSVASTMRTKHGMEVWADRTLARLEDVDAETIVVDGVRGLAEVERFREALGEGFVLIAVHASPETRFERAKARDRDDAPATLAEFKERDRRELDYGLGTAIALADVLVVNEASKAEFQDEVDRVLDRALGD